MIDSRVAESEYQHRARNAAAAYLMQSFGNFHNDVEAVLRSYFGYCALRMSCVDLARACGFLANQGVAVRIDDRHAIAHNKTQRAMRRSPRGFLQQCVKKSVVLTRCIVRDSSVIGVIAWE